MDGSLQSLPGAEVVESEVVEEPRRFEDFFGSEHARLFGALCLVTGDRHEAEEIMQDAPSSACGSDGTGSVGSTTRRPTYSERR